MGWFDKSKKTDKDTIVTIRGINYRFSGSYAPLGGLPLLFFIVKAMEGDSLACEILDAAGTKIINAEGDTIYPPQ